MTKVLILGGSGFVGSYLAKYLIEQKYSVDILTRGKKPIDYKGYNDHIKCDRLNESDLKAALSDKQYDCIFDISGYTQNDVSTLLNSIDRSQFNKYVFCSSVAIYKETFDRVDEEYPYCNKEEATDYAKNKIEAEELIINEINTSGLNAIIFRPTYIYGEGNNLYRESYFFDRILSSEEIPVPSDNSIRAQFIYIGDLVKAFECAIFSNKVGAYNVTNPEQVTFEQLVKICTDIIGKEITLKKIYPYDNIDVRSYFPFDNINMNYTITKLRQDGFHLPVTYLEDGLAQTYKWYTDVKPTLCDKKMINVDKV